MKTKQPLLSIPPMRKYLLFPLLAMAFLAGNELFSQDPVLVTIPGNFQDELGCPGDWDPACSNTFLTFDPADDVWQAVFSIPAGSWEYKAALDGTWDWNFGLNAIQNGPNIPLTLPGPEDVKFYYDHKTHWVTDNVNSAIAVAVGDFQPFLGGGGVWDPASLRSWLQDPDGDGIYTFLTDAIPPGDYEAKVAHNESWDENYGAGGVPDGPNIPFTVPSPSAWMFFSYELSTHILTITDVPPPPETGTIMIEKGTNTGDMGPAFSFTTNHYLTINTPGSIAGEYMAGGAFFGPQLDFNGISGDLELVNDMNGASPTDGCEPFSGFTPGNIAVVDRGICTFVSKVLNAQDAGAIGVIVVNNVEGQGFINMGGDAPGLTIPAIFISYEDGMVIKDALLDGGPVSGSMRSDLGGSFYLHHGDAIVFNDVPPGQYTVRELNAVLYGYNLSMVWFGDPDNESTWDFETSSITFDVDAGETVTAYLMNSACPTAALYPPELDLYVPFNGNVDASFFIDNYIDPAGLGFTFTIPGPLDDFETYAPGGQLACQNPTNWTTWSIAPCSIEDPYVSTNYALSGTNSVLIDYATAMSPVDLIKPLGHKTSGEWEMSFGMYIPDGKRGYFNTMAGFTPFPWNWGLECYFDADGTGYLFAGSPDPYIFSYPFDTWNNVVIRVNLDANVAQFFFNDVLLNAWPWTSGAFGGGSPPTLDAMDFFAASDIDEMYIDDFWFSRYPFCPLDITVNPVEGVIPDGGVQEFLVNVDAMGVPSGHYLCDINIAGYSCGGFLSVPLKIYVQDIEPPVINLAESFELWPVNHKYENIDLSEMIVSIVDNVDGLIPVEMAFVEQASSDEPDDAPGNGDGNTVNDIMIPPDCKSVDLRKERQGGGNGRVYTVLLSASDAAGNKAFAEFQVTVPHDQNGMAIDDGPEFTVFCGVGDQLSVLDPEMALWKQAGLLNIPNPFSTSTMIIFTLPETGSVQLKVYNAMGEEVAALFDGTVEEDVKQEILFSGNDLPHGVYYCRLQTESGKFAVRKMVLLK